jgi:mandelate racemase
MIAESVRASLTLHGLRARAVDVPMQRPLQTSGGTVGTAPLVLVDLTAEEGVVGRSYVFCYTPLTLRPVVQLVSSLEDILRGEALAPVAIEQDLQRRFRLLGAKGLTGIAIAAIDMAAWDALARAAGLPLARLLGGELRATPAYNSCGLGIIGAERAAAEARELVAPGFRAVKVRLGYSDLETDVAVFRAVRRAVGDEILLMTDYNQSLSVPEAARRARALDGEGVYWIEEPTLADDYVGHAQVRQEAASPIQMGENWWGRTRWRRA